jgi:DNA gyrase subunit A
MSILHGLDDRRKSARPICVPAWRDREDVECTLSPSAMPTCAKRSSSSHHHRNGYGKRQSTYEYRRTNRGGQGITNIDTSERNGGVVASFPVSPASS